MNALDKLKKKLLADYKVELKFSKSAAQDLKRFNKGKRLDILIEITRRAKNGPLIKPKGIGDPLHAPLHGFTKIKPKSLNIRIIYRPVRKDDDIIRMEIIAIGPRDKDKAYVWAAERLAKFLIEMSDDN